MPRIGSPSHGEAQDGVQPIVLARVDDERQPREPRPQRLAVHRCALGIHPAIVSSGLAVGPAASRS